MKNIDKIRAMSAEQLASVIVYKKCSYCDNKGVSGICSIESGLRSSLDCVMGIRKRLNQEVNPMPKLEVGDVLETGSDGCRYYYIGNDEAVRTIHTLQSQDLPIVRRFVSDIQGDIVKIWRDNDNSLLLGARRFDVIWRADNEPHKWQDKQE